MKDKSGLGKTAKYITTRKELLEVDLEDTDYLLGMFRENHLLYEDQRDPKTDPSLAEMTRTAVQLLSRNQDKGFFLLVEGGRIDQAHHKNFASRALNETVGLDLAVETVLKMINTSETLVIVTADHSHGMSFTGYNDRGSPVTGVADYLSSNGEPMLSLNYANGPGFYGYLEVNQTGGVQRQNLTEKEFNASTQYPATAFKSSATHGGEDVTIYAVGPMAHLFHQTHDQTHIFNVMAYSACIGWYRDNADPRCGLSSASGGSGVGPTLAGIALVVILSLLAETRL